MVYLIGYWNQERWHIKIGVSNNPIKRLKSLQTGNSHQLQLVKAISATAPRRVETSLHHQFRHYRQAGEWFVLDTDRLRILEQVLDRLAVGIVAC